jgi:signal peptidase I
MRVWLRLLILILVGALAAQTWLVLGLVTPVVVAGGSMAPSLVGAHYQVECPSCSRSFACGEDSIPADFRVVCPSCGAWSDLESAAVSPGDRLFVDRTAYLRGVPERWSIVVCPLPEDAKALCVKRAVGLPGEKITLSDGDVYVDGKILRKDWVTLQSLTIVVDAAEYQPTAETEVSRWLPERTDSGWHATNKGFKVDDAEPSTDSPVAVDWLTYHHEQILRQGANVVRQEAPILDDLAYNQNESRELVTVPDAVLTCRLQAASEGEVWLRANDGRKEFFIRLDLANRTGELRDGGQEVAQFKLPATIDLKRPCELALALADSRLQLIIAQTPIVDYLYDPTDCPPREPTAEPFSIGTAGGPLSFTGWVVSRDIYYLPPVGKSASEPRQLGPTEYWLLGDNSAVSDDSRTWPADVRMTRDALVGKILRWR